MLWGVLSLTGTVYLGNKMFASSDKRMFLPGETTHGHYQIELSCDACHTPGMGVKQDACLNCHGEELEAAQDSHPKSKFDDPTKAGLLKKVKADECISCHTEHNPEVTHPMGVTIPMNYCGFCHQEVGENRPSHKGLEYDTCATAGCHNYHDNRALYERFLRKHAEEPDMKTNRVERVMSEPRVVRDPLTLADHNAPKERDWDPAVLAEWAEGLHARQGVNCMDCHDTADGWVDHPTPSSCSSCHEEPVRGWLAGRHGMRVAAGLSPMQPAMARQPMAPHSLHRELNCVSCHGSHDFNTQYAAADACLDCHVDDHSLAFRNTKHFDQGLSCASCHMPRTELENGRIGVQHNQNDNLRPNEKMVRSVCMDCHGIEFSLKALADPAQMAACYDAAPGDDLQTLEWVRTRVKEIEARRRATEEARKKKKKKVINEDDL